MPYRRMIRECPDCHVAFEGDASPKVQRDFQCMVRYQGEFLNLEHELAGLPLDAVKKLRLLVADIKGALTH